MKQKINKNSVFTSFSSIILIFTLLFAGVEYSYSQTPSWENTHGPCGETINDIKVHPGGLYFLAAYEYGIYRSSNMGTSWVKKIIGIINNEVYI
jgi:hypothetical protein